MYTYYGVLKDGIYFVSIRKILKAAGVKVLDYYSDPRIVKFKSIKELTTADFDYFVLVELEKSESPLRFDRAQPPEDFLGGESFKQFRVK